MNRFIFIWLSQKLFSLCLLFSSEILFVPYFRFCKVRVRRKTPRGGKTIAIWLRSLAMSPWLTCLCPDELPVTRSWPAAALPRSGPAYISGPRGSSTQSPDRDSDHLELQVMSISNNPKAWWKSFLYQYLILQLYLLLSTIYIAVVFTMTLEINLF